MPGLQVVGNRLVADRQFLVAHLEGLGILLEAGRAFENQALDRFRITQRVAQHRLAAERVTVVVGLLDAELADDQGMERITDIGQRTGHRLVDVARPGHPPLRHVGGNHAEAALNRILHQVAVVRAEGALAVDDDKGRRIALLAAILVHVAEFPFDAALVLDPGVLDRERGDHLITPEGLLRVRVHVDPWPTPVLGLADDTLVVVDHASRTQEGLESLVALQFVRRLEDRVVRGRVLEADIHAAGDLLRRLARFAAHQPQVVVDMHHEGTRLHPRKKLVDIVEFADRIAIPEVDCVELGCHARQVGADVLAEARVVLPGKDVLGYRIPAERLAEIEIVAGEQELRPVELDALVRMLVLGQLVVIGLGLDPDRVGLQRRLGQLEGPRGHLSADPIGCRSAADRHHRLDEVGIHQAPVVGLGATHRHAGGQHHLPDLEMIAQQAVVQVHHVVVAVNRELAGQPVRRLRCSPQTQAVEEDDIEPVGIEQQAGTDQRATREAVAGLAGIPAVVHGGRITREEGADHDRIDDLALLVFLRRTDRDVGGLRGARAERFERRSPFAAVLPGLRGGQVVLAADLEIFDLVGLLDAVQRRYGRARGDGLLGVGCQDECRAQHERRHTTHEPPPTRRVASHDLLLQCLDCAPECTIVAANGTLSS